MFPRGDLPTVTGVDRAAGRRAACSGRSQAGLAQLTVGMLEEGTLTRTAEQIALAGRVDGGDDRRHVRLGGCVRLVQMLEVRLSARVWIWRLTSCGTRHFPRPSGLRVRGQTLAALKAERDHAESRAPRALLAAIYPEDHPYRFPLAGTEAGRRSSIEQRWPLFTRGF